MRLLPIKQAERQLIAVVKHHQIGTWQAATFKKDRRLVLTITETQFLITEAGYQQTTWATIDANECRQQFKNYFSAGISSQSANLFPSKGWSSMTTFYFIRHGQTEANVAGLKQGQINTPNTYLTSVGKQQAESLAERFSIHFADYLFYSPLTRTKQTATILNQQAQLPMTADSRLLEISYGEWDGQDNNQLFNQYPRYFDPTIHEVLPTYVEMAPHGETFQAVVDRVTEFMNAKSQEFPNGQLIVVTHGFTVKAAALAVTQVADPMSIPEPDNTSVTQIDFAADTQTGYLIKYNS